MTAVETAASDPGVAVTCHSLIASRRWKSGVSAVTIVAAWRKAEGVVYYKRSNAAERHIQSAHGGHERFPVDQEDEERQDIILGRRQGVTGR